MATMAAIDLGAQTGRVALGRYDGKRLSVVEVHRFANVPVRVGGTLHWDILRLYGDVVDGLRAAGRDEHRVRSVGVDSWALDFALLDRAGRLVQNPVHYRNARRAGAMAPTLEHVPARELYERTGIQLIPINTVFELAAMAEERDPALEVAETMLLIPDLFHYWLAGSRVSEFTNATTTQCFDPRGGSWAFDVLERLGIPTDVFPEVVSPATSLGTVLPDVVELTGLAGTEVIATATHDTASAIAAIPFRRAGSAYVSAGTWSLVGIELNEPAIDDRTFAANLTNEGGVAGTFRLLRNATGLWLLHECRRIWALDGRAYAFSELVDLAREASPLRSLIDPDDPLFATSGDMPQRVRDFCLSTGQEQPAGPAEVVRCILESLALKHAQAIELIRRATGVVPEEVHIVGGGARNDLLCRWTANATGMPVRAGPVEATAIGNLILQAIALGELASLEDARELIRASFDSTVYEPEDSSSWYEARDRFVEVAAPQVRREMVG